MAKKIRRNIRGRHQRKIYDHLFIAIFGRNTEQSKKWRLELYNALRGTSYTDPDALELNTIENVIYIKMHNDVSFLVDSQMTLYEHQSTPNPNMPLRGLMYFSQLYQKHIDSEGLSLLSSRRIKIPNPNFIVFYNGDSERPERYDLRLSDSFIADDRNGRFEWTAHVVNINEKYNEALQKKCKPLYDYVRFVSRIKENKRSGMGIEDAVSESVEWACKENILDGFIRSQKQEVVAMSLTEYDEEECIRTWRNDGIEEGVQMKAEEATIELLKENISPEIIAKCEKLPLERVLELQKEIMAKA